MNLNQRLESVGQLAAGIAPEIDTPVQFVNDSVHFLRDLLNDFKIVLASHKQRQQSVSAGHPNLYLALAAEQSEQTVDLDYLLANAPLAANRALEGPRTHCHHRALHVGVRASRPGRKVADLNRAVTVTLDVARNECKYIADIITDFGDITPVSCYASEINEVLLNLVVNAAHASAVPFTLRVHQAGDIGWVISRHGSLYTREFGRDATFEALVAKLVQRFSNSPMRRPSGAGLQNGMVCEWDLYFWCARMQQRRNCDCC